MQTFGWRGERLRASRILVSKGVGFLGTVSRVLGPWGMFCYGGGGVSSSDLENIIHASPTA